MRKERHDQADRSILSPRDRPEFKVCRTLCFLHVLCLFFPSSLSLPQLYSDEKNSFQADSIPLKRGQRIFSRITRS